MNDEVFFQGDEDAWDDTALVKAYNRAIAAFEKEYKANPTGEPRPRRKWQVGDRCRAVWSGDGEVYGAVIESIAEEDGFCTVAFKDYDSSGVMDLVDLLPPKEVGSAHSQGQSRSNGGASSAAMEPAPGSEKGHAKAAPAEAAGAAAAAAALSSTAAKATGGAAGLHTQWQVGDKCRCEYAVDGLSYDAEISSISADRKTCSVLFAHYGNTQHGTPLCVLQPAGTGEAGSTGGPAHKRRRETEDANAQEHRGLSHQQQPQRPQQPQAFSSSPFQAPLPGMANMPEMQAPGVAGLLAEDQSHANMLMAWYQTGFYTGYYQAQRQFQQQGSTR